MNAKEYRAKFGGCLEEKIEKIETKNAELKKELNEVGRKWLNDFSRQDTLITELKARWEELKSGADDWIRFEKREKLWVVMAEKSDKVIGYIKWYFPWRHYCFFPIDDTVFSDRCMMAIGAFIEELSSGGEVFPGRVHIKGHNSGTFRSPKTPKPESGYYRDRNNPKYGLKKVAK